MQFKFRDFEEEDIVYTSDLYYDFFDGGYVCPYDMLKDKEQMEAVRDARLLIESFFQQAEKKGVLIGS